MLIGVRDWYFYEMCWGCVNKFLMTKAKAHQIGALFASKDDSNY